MSDKPAACLDHDLDRVTWRCVKCGKKAPFALERIAPETYRGMWDWGLNEELERDHAS